MNKTKYISTCLYLEVAPLQYIRSRVIRNTSYNYFRVSFKYLFDIPFKAWNILLYGIKNRKINSFKFPTINC